MEHGSGKHVKDTEVTVKTEVEEAIASILIDAKYMNEEPGLGQLMKSEPASLVKEEILEDCTRGTSTPAYTGGGNEACSKSLFDLLNFKDEYSDMDIGPTVLQHMDTHYEINQNTSAATEENTIADDCSAAIPCKRMKKESLEDKLRGTGEWRGVPGTSACATDRTSVARDSVERQMKEEDADLNIGPTLLRHIDSHYRTNQMSSNRNIWVPASGDVLPGKLQDYLEREREEYLEESGSDLDDSDVAVEDGICCAPSLLTDSGAGYTESLSSLPQTDNEDHPTPVPDATPDARNGLPFESIIMTSSFSPRPGTSRDSEQWAGLVDEDAFRSRSPLPGPSRESLPWATVQDEDENVVDQEEWLQEEEEETLVREEEGSMDVLADMPDFVNPTPCLHESVAPRRPVQRGLRSRGVRARGATPCRGRRAATFATNDESRWRLGERSIEACVTDEDVPHRLGEVTDHVHERNVRRDQQVRRRFISEYDESDSDYDSDTELGLFGGDSTALHFDWSSMETYQSSAEEFLPETTGPVRSVSSAYDAFRVYWDDDIMQHIVVETNRHAADISLRSPQFAREWIDTNVDEIMIIFAFWMALGIHNMPTLQSCFSLNPVLQTNIFASLFTQKRYHIVNRALHFVDNSTRTPQSSRLFSLGPVIDHLKAAFMNAYTPGRDISIDESLTLWKGNLVFKQFIETKAAKFGIKTFELCDSATGYLWAFNVYTGKDTSGASSSTLPKSTKAVLDLITPLLNKGYRLFMDNWFNSPILARYLKRNGTDCVGRLRKNRRNVPPLIQCATLPRGHFVARHAGDVMVMAYQGTKTVHTISTCHGVDLVQISARPGRPSHHKPAVIADCIKYMGGVDKKDQMLEPYLIERKRCQKWSRKLFKRLLNVSILNSRILLRQSSNDQCEHLVFRVDLVEEIVRRHLSQVPQPRQFRRQVSNNIPGLPDDRLLDPGQHFIVRARDGDEPLTGRNRSSKNRGLCQWCKVRDERYSKTVYKCEYCNVYLCLINCFKNYHTLRE